ncbi:MAG: ABC transporter permease subunit [Gaiellaceae bacterium MAG52_C11]|nr:ABC transporter permease subunit [Candidatus Gaiellasilicea maunaloa]
MSAVPEAAPGTVRARRVAARAGRSARRLLAYTVLLSFSLYILGPFAAIMVTAVGQEWFGGRWFPGTWTFKWFTFARSLADLPALLTNSLVIAGLSIVISLAVGLPTAWALAKRQIRARGLLIALILLPRMVPPITIGLGVSREFYNFGLVDTHIGVAFAHSILIIPLVVLIMSATFEGLDDRVLEAARVCGANSFYTLWNVVRPLVMPGLLASALFGLITSLNEFTLTLLTYGPRTITLTVQTYIAISQGFKEVASALSVILIIPSLILLILIQKQIKPENMVGGAKGL